MYLVGVNYASHEILRDYLAKWSAVEGISHIVIVDCFSSREELLHVSEMCAKTKGCSLIASDNIGYGAALNIGLEKVISIADSEAHAGEDVLVLFGNVDVLPINVSTQTLGKNQVPLLNIYEGGRQRNPFLTTFQSRFLWVTKLASKYRSRTILGLWKTIYRTARLIPSKKSYAVHGAMFGLSVRQVKLCSPIFDSRVFLYCEELFFSRAIHRSSFKFTVSDISVEHIGSVSTSKTIKKDRRFFFKNWCISNNIFFETNEHNS